MSTQIPPSTARRVIGEVCAAVDYVTPDDVMSNIRFHRVVRARQAAMAILAVRCQTAGLSVLARAVGRADHSTVINAMRVVGRECGFSIRAHGPSGAPKAEAVPDAFFRTVIEWVSRVPISNDHATHIRAKTKATHWQTGNEGVIVRSICLSSKLTQDREAKMDSLSELKLRVSPVFPTCAGAKRCPLYCL